MTLLESKVFDAQKLASIKKKLQAEAESGKIPGVNYLIAHQGKIIDRAEIGFANLETQKPMQPETLFRTFSLTKPLTSFAVLKLMEEGKIGLANPVTKYLPEFKKLKVWTENGAVDLKKPMTVAHLLTHRSGFGYSQFPKHPVAEMTRDFFRKARNNPGFDIDETMKGLAEIPLYIQPGNDFLYGMSADILEVILRRVTGQKLEDYLQDNLFNPLGMINSYFTVPSSKKEFCSKDYTKSKTSGKLIELPEGTFRNYFKKDDLIKGGDAFVCAIDDYLKFAQMILNDGTLNGIRVMKKETVRLMKSSQIPDGLEVAFLPGAGFSYGFAVFTHPERHEISVSKGELCWSGFGHTTCWIDPIKKVIILQFAQLFPFGKPSLFKGFRQEVGEAMNFSYA